MIRLILQVCAYVVGIPLEILIITALLRGPYRRFPLFFAYMVTLFVFTIVETPLYVIGYGFRHAGVRSTYIKLYWVDDQILLGLVFLLVVSLIYEATTELKTRRTIRLALAGGAVVFAAVTFWIHYDSGLRPGEWMTPWTSNLNFCAAVLDFALWTMLLAARRKDRQVLLLAAGLGIQFTGEAIGEAIRHMAQPSRSTSLTLTGATIMIMTNLMHLYVWRQAFRPARQAKALSA